MKQSTRTFLVVLLSAATLVALMSVPTTADDDPVITADKALISAFEKGDKATVEKYLDAGFTWVDPNGVMVEREDALNLGMKPLLGEGSNLKIRENKIGDKVVWLHVDTEKSFVGRVWVKRASGWKLLHTTEIATRPPSEMINVHSPFAIPCVNPCQQVPFRPVDKMQAATLADWQVQIGSREAFATHVDDNQAMVTTYTGQNPTKGSRYAGPPPPPNPGPAVGSNPVLWMRMWSFPPDTVVVLACQPAYGQRAYWSSRVFHFQHGYWQMMESYHNTIEASGAMTEVEGK
jgi:hypothetical protein